MKNERLKLISLTANKEMAATISTICGAKILDTNVIHFADNEVFFEGNESFRGFNIYIIQSTCTPVTDRLMEVLLCIDACKRGSAKSVTCVMPYFGYARQDRKSKPRQPISAKLVANLLTVAGADRIVSVDLHASQIAGFFDIPVDDMSPVRLFESYFKKLNLSDIICVSPDHGGVVRTTKLATRLNAPIAIIDKRRPRPNQAEIIGIVGDVKGKDCVIVDDIVDTAGTLCLAASKLKELGAKRVYAAITHGVLSGEAVEKIKNSEIEKIIITDSIPLDKEKQCEKIEVVSLAPLLAEIIVAIENGESLFSAVQRYEKEN